MLTDIDRFTSTHPITADTSVNFEILNSSVLEQVTHMSQTDRQTENGAWMKLDQNDARRICFNFSTIFS